MRALAAIILAWAGLYYLGRTWGTTRVERQRSLAGDDLVPDATCGGDHAITIDTAPDFVWPWLVQMGWRRGGWYTYRWVDRLLFPRNFPSADRILPELQDLHVGDHIPDGPPHLGCYFVVEQMEPRRHLVLRSTTHLPPQLLQRPDVGLNWSWAFVLTPEHVDSTRFYFRWRAAVRPRWLRLVSNLLIVPADFVMARSMCMGLKQRAEALAASSTASDARHAAYRSDGA